MRRLKKKHSAADVLEGLWIMIRTVMLFGILLTGLYLIFDMGFPFLVTIPVLAIYIVSMGAGMIRYGFHVMLHGYYEETY